MKILLFLLIVSVCLLIGAVDVHAQRLIDWDTVSIVDLLGITDPPSWWSLSVPLDFGKDIPSPLLHCPPSGGHFGELEELLSRTDLPPLWSGSHHAWVPGSRPKPNPSIPEPATVAILTFGFFLVFLQQSKYNRRNDGRS